MALQIEVCSINGHLCHVVIEPNLNVLDLKRCVEKSTGIKIHAQTMISGTHRLCNADILACLGLEQPSIMCMRRDPEVTRWLDHMDRMPSCEMLGVTMKDLESSPPVVKADFEVMQLLARRNLEFLKYAMPSLLADEQFVIGLAELKPAALQWASETLRASSSFISAASKFDRHALRMASDALRADRDFVRQLAVKSRWALSDASEEIQSDKSFNDSVLAEIRREYIKDSLKSNGRSLRRASDLRGDRDVVLVAIQSDPDALEWASPELRNDSCIIQAAQGFPNHEENLRQVKVNTNSHIGMAYERFPVVH